MSRPTNNMSEELFKVDGKTSVGETLPLALQHVVAMIVGCVTPAIIVAGVAGLSEQDSVILIQAALTMSAITTLIQVFPLLRTGKIAIGSGLPVIMGISFAYVPTMQAIAGRFDIATILGAQIVGGIVAVFVGIFITMVGMYFMMKTEEGLTLNTGDIFALCSAFFFALHVVFMSKYVLESDPVVITEGQFLLLSFISAIIALGIEPLEPVATAEISIWINIIFSAMVGSVGYSWTDLCTDANFYNDIGRCYAGRRTNFAWKGRSTFSCPRYYYRWQAEYLFNGN